MIIFFVFVLGLCVGSFLNVLILRLHANESLWKEGSHCLKCHKKIRWLELIPVLSFLYQGGRCRSCQTHISWQYPLVELATGFLFALPFILNSKFYILDSLLFWIVVSALIAIFVYDFKFGEIPDIFVFIPALILLSLYIFISFFNFLPFGFWENLFLNKFYLLAPIIGGGFFGSQHLISKGRWIGAGDTGLGVLMGLILGWPKILIALFLAYVVGALIGIFLLILHKKSLKSTLPFGVFLVPATFITMFWGERIIQWYLSLLFL